MKIHNFLPAFSDCMKRWKTVPTWEEFSEQYYSLMAPLADITFSGASLYQSLPDLNWNEYREKTLQLDPERELLRLEKQLQGVQSLFGLPMEGEIVLLGAFEAMDGYARFEGGKHRVFLGVDENFQNGAYLDVLMAHELTHVVRESRPEVWAGFGLKLQMTHDEFTENLPVVEHVFSEGFSCAISEILVPAEEPWHYAYQEKENIPYIVKHAEALDHRIHHEIRKDQNNRAGDYSSLYRVSGYVPQMPLYSHYYWAWQWTKQVIKDIGGGDPKKIVSVSSQEFVEHALRFKLKDVLNHS
jgi:hypothetical protein